jgi:hypothetical protein
MKKEVFKKQPYSGFFIFAFFLASPFVFGLFFLLTLGLCQRIFGTVSFTSAIMSALISSALVICYLIKILSLGLTKITITEQKITIKSLFKHYQLNWAEIREFGRILRPIKTQETLSHSWDYYLKFSQDEKKIFISNSQVKNATRLCHLIFKYAFNAKFVTMLRHQLGSVYEIQEWENETEQGVKGTGTFCKP